MYKLFTDKKENFECKIELEGASLDDAVARLVVESKKLNLLFEGTIDNKGNCSIPIDKLRGLLKEDDSGSIKLEVIAEDVYFNPWESDFIVDTSKKIKVEIKEQSKSSKPKAKVSEIKQNTTKKVQKMKKINKIDKIVEILKTNEINTAIIYENKKEMVPLLKEYAKKIGYDKNIKVFLKEIMIKLSK